MSSRIVLFGESGFVGSNLLKYMRAPGVVAPTLNEADLTDSDSLRRILRAGDIVVNAAGYANATDTTERGRALFETVNVSGVRNLASACAETGAAQLVHISSVAAMGRWHGEGITEGNMKPVNSPYAKSKLEGERILAEFTSKLPITVLRPTSVFGEGRGLARTLCRIVTRGRIPLPAGGRALIPFTYIANVAHGVELTLGNEKCFGRTFIVGDPRSYTLREIVLELADAMRLKPKIVAVPSSLAYAGAMGFEALAKLSRSSPLLDRGRLDTLTNSVSYSISAFQAATGYEPPYDLRKAVERIVSWYVTDRDKRQAGS